MEWESDIGFVIGYLPSGSQDFDRVANRTTSHVERANFYIKPKKQDAEMSQNIKLQVWSCWKDGICDIDFNSTRHLYSPDRREYAQRWLVIFEDSRPFFLIPCKTEPLLPPGSMMLIFGSQQRPKAVLVSRPHSHYQSLSEV